MVHGLAAQSGGALLLASAPGEGTRAEIWIPAAGETAPPTRDMETPHVSNNRSATILLVDDEDLVRMGTAELLKDLGHVIIEATSAAHAIDLLRNGATPDLLITDYLMPGMRGTDLAVEVGRLQPDLPILLLTGYANLAGHQLADLPLLPKPFRQAELAARIAALLDKRAKAGVDRRELRSAE
jgi:CheY-like chemotaxis protein